MREFAAMSILNVWYARFGVEDALARLKSDLPRSGAPDQGSDRQSPHPGQHAGAGETDDRHGRGRRIISGPPLIVPLEELAATSTSTLSTGSSAACSAGTRGPCRPTGAGWRSDSP